MRLTHRGRILETPGRDHLERMMTARPPAVTLKESTVSGPDAARLVNGEQWLTG
jgi:hypothetical protein